MSNKVNKKQVQHISELAQIPVTDKESEELATAFSETMDVVDQLKTANVDGVPTTHQVTGFKNVLREDIVDESRSFSQEEALANAQQQQDGYFVVPQVLQNKNQ